MAGNEVGLNTQRRCRTSALLVAVLLFTGAVGLFVTPSMLTPASFVHGSPRSIIVAALVLTAAMIAVSACRPRGYDQDGERTSTERSKSG